MMYVFSDMKMQCDAAEIEQVGTHTYLESKHGLKPVKEIFISLLLVVGLLLLLVVRVVFIVLVLGPWQAPSIPKGVNRRLNLQIRGETGSRENRAFDGRVCN
jgi:hypothetical protein